MSKIIPIFKKDDRQLKENTVHFDKILIWSKRVSISTSSSFQTQLVSADKKISHCQLPIKNYQPVQDLIF